MRSSFAVSANRGMCAIYRMQHGEETETRVQVVPVRENLGITAHPKNPARPFPATASIACHLPPD